MATGLLQPRQKSRFCFGYWGNRCRKACRNCKNVIASLYVSVSW